MQNLQLVSHKANRQASCFELMSGTQVLVYQSPPQQQHPQKQKRRNKWKSEQNVAHATLQKGLKIITQNKKSSAKSLHQVLFIWSGPEEAIPKPKK